jgi:phage replication O-like protein O
MTDAAQVYQFPGDTQEQGATDTDGGYTRIPNYVLDRLCEIGLNKRESKVLLTIIRKTFGYNKARDWIGREQIAEITGVAANHVSESVKRLEARNIIERNGRFVGINKSVSDWLDDAPKACGNVADHPKKNEQKSQNGDGAKTPERGTQESRKRDAEVPEQGRMSPENGRHKRHNTITKDNITKESARDAGAFSSNQPGPAETEKPKRKGTTSSKEFITALIDKGVDAEVANAFADQRKSLKCPMTARVITLIDNQAAQAGITLQEAIDLMILRSWKGFQAEWLKNTPNGRSAGTAQRREFSQVDYSDNEGFFGHEN